MEDSDTRCKATIQQWRTAAETGDADLAVDAAADAVVVRSPLTDRIRFEGRDELRHLLSVATKSIVDIRFHAVLGEEHTWALFYTARVRGQSIEEAQLIRLNEQGKIAEVTLLARPLPGLTALMDTLGPPLARRFGRPPAIAALLSAMARPLSLLTRTGDRHAVGLVKAGPD
jgi:hypothetical protein